MCEKFKTFVKEHKYCVSWVLAIILILALLSAFREHREDRYNHFSRDGRGNYEMKFDKDSSWFERGGNERNFRNNNETTNQMMNRGNMMNAQSGANLAPNQMMQVQQNAVNANTGTSVKTNTGASIVK